MKLKKRSSYNSVRPVNNPNSVGMVPVKSLPRIILPPQEQNDDEEKKKRQRRKDTNSRFGAVSKPSSVGRVPSNSSCQPNSLQWNKKPSMRGRKEEEEKDKKKEERRKKKTYR